MIAARDGIKQWRLHKIQSRIHEDKSTMIVDLQAHTSGQFLIRSHNHLKAAL